MAGEVLQKQYARGRTPGRRRRRIGVRIDMTPMVDIAFLLLIFYMVTTVFAMPQAMEINLPPDDDPVEQKSVLTVRVDSEGRYWWNLGMVTTDNLPVLLPSGGGLSGGPVYTIDTDSLRGLLLQQNRIYAKLSTLLLIHKKAPFNAMVDILDEIEMVERVFNAARAQELGVDYDQLPSDRRFSYRYALGEWENKDDNIIIDAVQKAKEGGQL